MALHSTTEYCHRQAAGQQALAIEQRWTMMPLSSKAKGKVDVWFLSYSVYLQWPA
jgi:hypothetical protein